MIQRAKQWQALGREWERSAHRACLSGMRSANRVSWNREKWAAFVREIPTASPQQTGPLLLGLVKWGGNGRAFLEQVEKL